MFILERYRGKGSFPAANGKISFLKKLPSGSEVVKFRFTHGLGFRICSIRFLANLSQSIRLRVETPNADHMRR